MKLVKWCVALVALSALGLAAGAYAPAPAGPSVEGSWMLDYREMPDGTKVRAPDVVGMMTFTKDHRNFNVYWKEKGKAMSIGVVSRYTLSAKEYHEENIYYAMNDEAAGKGMTYDTTSTKGSSPVTVKGDKTEFAFPLHDEPTTSWEKGTFTATRKGDHGFVDHWKKVD